MKTLKRALIAALFLALGVFDSAAQAPDRFPVGDTNYFLQSGAAVVGETDWGFGYWKLGASTNDPASEVDLVGTPLPLSYGGGTPDQLVAATKQRIAAYFAGGTNTAPVPGYLTVPLPRQFTAHHQETYWMWVTWYAPVGSSYPSIFTYEVTFQLVQGADGKWAPPDWVLGNLALQPVSLVLLRLPGLYGARVRWWDGSGFTDTGVPYPPTTAKSSGVGVASATNSFPSYLITDPASGTVALPAEPILGKDVGVLTLVFTNGTIVRYSTGTGAQVQGVQREQEPPFMSFTYHPPYSSDTEIGAWGNGWTWIGSLNGGWAWNKWDIHEWVWVGPEIYLEAFTVWGESPPPRLLFEQSSDLTRWEQMGPTNQWEESSRTIPLWPSPNQARIQWATKLPPEGQPSSVYTPGQLDALWWDNGHPGLQNPPAALEEPTDPPWWKQTQKPGTCYYRVRY